MTNFTQILQPIPLRLTLGARGFSCAVSDVGYVSTVTRASPLVSVSEQRENKPLVPRVIKAKLTYQTGNTIAGLTITIRYNQGLFIHKRLLDALCAYVYSIS